MIRLFIVVLLAVLADGCASPRYPGTSRLWEMRAPVADTTGPAIVFTGPLDWYVVESDERYDAVLPAGTYPLEAQDNDYRYYKSPNPISLVQSTSEFDRNVQPFAGGLFLAKNAGAKYSSGAYVEYKDGHKLLVLSFDYRFMGQEGTTWHYKKE